eukprot:2779128-Alexandrium_andersonii.AAC.1
MCRRRVPCSVWAWCPRRNPARTPGAAAPLQPAGAHPYVIRCAEHRLWPRRKALTTMAPPPAGERARADLRLPPAVALASRSRPRRRRCLG